MYNPQSAFAPSTRVSYPSGAATTTLPDGSVVDGLFDDPVNDLGDIAETVSPPETVEPSDSDDPNPLL